MDLFISDDAQKKLIIVLSIMIILILIIGIILLVYVKKLAINENKNNSLGAQESLDSSSLSNQEILDSSSLSNQEYDQKTRDFERNIYYSKPLP